MAVVAGINAVIGRYTEFYPGQQDCLPYASTDDLLQEMTHLRAMRRANFYNVVGDPIILNNPPAWLYEINNAPFEGSVSGKWILLIAIDTMETVLGLSYDADHLLWSAFSSMDIQVMCTCLNNEMRMYFSLPFDTTLSSEACVFMRNYVDLHLKHQHEWSMETDFELANACHDGAIFAPRPMHTTLPLTDVQCSTVQWLETRLDREGTVNTLFLPYKTMGRRNIMYSNELRCLTIKQAREWSYRRVLLADTMAGKDTAVVVYLHNRLQRHGKYIIVCATPQIALQWNRKLALQGVTAQVFTYIQIQEDDFFLPRGHVLVLDSAVAFRHVIFTYVNMDIYDRVIMLAPYLPTTYMAWRLLAPSNYRSKVVWMNALRYFFITEIYKSCILTHEHCLDNNLIWTYRNVPHEQPLLYSHWRQENLAYFASLSHTNSLVHTASLNYAISRFQEGLLGFVNAPTVHYLMGRSVTQNMCSICLEPEAVIPIQTLCNHTFCTMCLHHWLKQTTTCPLCRSVVTATQRIEVPMRMIEKPRIPFVRKQLVLRDLLRSVTKAVVISRHVNALVNFSQQWKLHETFYGAGESLMFNLAESGVLCIPAEHLDYNIDITTTVPLVVVLEPYSDTHVVTKSINRLFSFARDRPMTVMLQSDAVVDSLIPKEAPISDLLAVFSA